MADKEFTLEALQAKYMGKLVRLMEDGEPYDESSDSMDALSVSKGVVTALVLTEDQRWGFRVRLDDRPGWWYINRYGSPYHLEIYQGEP